MSKTTTRAPSESTLGSPRSVASTTRCSSIFFRCVQTAQLRVAFPNEIERRSSETWTAITFRSVAVPQFRRVLATLMAVPIFREVELLAAPPAAALRRPPQQTAQTRRPASDAAIAT